MRPEVHLNAIIRRQHGAFSVRQAVEAGVSERVVRNRVALGEWGRPHRGVVVDLATPPTPERAAMAAVLACGPRAVASHLTAARLFGFFADGVSGLSAKQQRDATPYVTVPAETHPRAPRIHVVRTKHLGRGDVARVREIPVTTPARTILDCASIVSPDGAEATLDRALRAGLVSPKTVHRYLAKRWCRTRAGARGLRAAVRDRIGAAPAETELESLYIRLLRRYGVPLPVLQYWVDTSSGPRRLDGAYPEHMVAIELDGYAGRRDSVAAFDDDRARQNDIEALGWTVRRFTWRHLSRDPGLVALRTAEAIGLMPTRWKPSRGTRPSRYHPAEDRRSGRGTAKPALWTPEREAGA